MWCVRGGKIAGAGLLAIVSTLHSQPSSGGNLILRSETRVVVIDVSVRDANGKPVEDLIKSDFMITDNGKPRSFSIFSASRSTPSLDTPLEAPSPPSEPPLPPNTFTNLGQPKPTPTTHSTVILLDAVNGWFDNYSFSRAGVLGMLSKVPPDERIALYVLAKHRGLVILQDYTLDRSVLQDTVRKYIPEGMCPAPPVIEAELGDAGMNRSGGPGARMGECRDLKSMDSDVESFRQSLDALATNLRNQRGRKSVFWVTQGFPPSLLRQDQFWDETISKLNDANIAINSIDSNGLGGPLRYWGPGGILTVRELAERTGGTAYFHRNDLDDALAEGITGSRSSYALGFYLTEPDGKYHGLKVSVGRPNLQLNYRQGYDSVDEAKPAKSKKNTDLSAAPLNPADSYEIGITVSLVAKSAGPRSAITVKMRLAPEALSLKTGKAGKTGTVKELFVERDAAGKVVGQQSTVSRFEVGPEKQATFSNRGVVIEQPLQLPPGVVSLSIVVQDTESGRTGSLTVPLGNVAPGGLVPVQKER